jgi:hypothetical protein
LFVACNIGSRNDGQRCVVPALSSLRLRGTKQEAISKQEKDCRNSEYSGKNYSNFGNKILMDISALWQLHHILPNAKSGVYCLQMGILTMSVTQKSGISIIFYTFARFLSGIYFI